MKKMLFYIHVTELLYLREDHICQGVSESEIVTTKCGCLHICVYA